jgi:hypothetical protein
MPQVLAAVGAAISYIGASITAATASASFATASATAATAAAAGASAGAAFAAGVAVGNAVFAVGTGVAALFGASSIVGAVKAWSTVALLASTALRPSGVGRGAAGTQVDFQADPLAAIPLMLGTSGTAGKIIHANTSGPNDKNTSLFYLLALTAGPLGQFVSMTANEWPITFAGETVTAPPQFAENAMLVRITPGAKPDAQAYYPPALDPALIPEWTDAHRLSGVACCWWHLVYNPEAFPTGTPRPLFVIQGPPVYDPRADSTYPGGSGPQRWDDETSWSFAGNDNPYLQGLTWAIGRRDNGVLTFGVGAPIDAIDVPAFVEGANVAEANAWKVGGEVLSHDRKWDVLKTILQAGGGEPLKLAGKLSCHIRTPRVALATLTGSDAVGAVSITGTKSRRDRFNQIIPNYRSPEHRYEVVPAGAVTVDAYVTADGGVRSREGTYTLVQDAKHAAELAAYDILDAREFEPVVLPLGPQFLGYKAGDCLTVDEPEFGLIAQQVIIQTRDLDLASGRVTLTCRSETPGKHAYALGRTPNPPPIPGLSPTDPTFVSQPAVGVWAAVGGVLAGADGSRVPAIIVTGHVDDPNVLEVLVEYRLQLSPGVFGEWVKTSHPRSVRRIELRAVTPSGFYNVVVRYRSVRGVEAELARDLGIVQAGALVSGGVTDIGGLTPGQLVDQLNDVTTATDYFATQYVLAVGTPPEVAGMRIASPAGEGAVSSIAFLADEIGFTNGADPGVYPLAVTGGRVIATNFQADDIRANTITVDKIVSNSIAIATVWSQPSLSVPLVSSGRTRVTEFGVTHNGRPVDISFFASTNFSEQSGVAYYLTAYDAANNLLFAAPSIVANSGTRAALWPFISCTWLGRWTPPAIWVHYILEAINGSGGAMTCTSAYILATEQRTQSL